MTNRCSSPADKIALFRSLFRGREDVYPQRFESRKTGKSGYSPACANEWIRDVCDKRRYKCADCPNRRFLPVTDKVIRQHLCGKDEAGQDFTAGVYPMLLDETCWFLAMDFDKEQWSGDVDAVRETFRQMQLPVSVERSRSGNGAHVWLFFEEAVPAVTARKLGAHILTATMVRRPEIGLDSYDRFFPNQDTLPKGGFGNLIALPLQHKPRDCGNSVFVDETLNPYEDQWAYLAGVARISRSEVEMIVTEAEKHNEVTGVRYPISDEHDDAPWAVPPSGRAKDPPITDKLPKTVDVMLGNQIYIAKESLPASLRNRLIRLAAFQNPEFYKAQAMRFPTFDKPRIIACAEEYKNHIGLPRGCLDELLALLAALKIEPRIQDERCHGICGGFSFHGKLRTEQQLAADTLLKHDTGVLSATTAFGKTVVASWLIAQRGGSTLVLVHRKQLLEQWIERLSAFLEIPVKTIGRVGGGRRRITGVLDVALMQSLVRKGVVDDMVGEYGHLIVDECHHLSAASFEQVARQAKARYVTGLSATVTRQDGHHPIIFMQCGPVRYRVNAKATAASRPFLHSVIVRPTAFQFTADTGGDKRQEFQALYGALAIDDDRNDVICEDVLAAVKEGRSPVVLTERTDHLRLLAERLSPAIRNLIVLQGGMKRTAFHEAIARLAGIPDNEERVLLATGSYLGEGFDDARLDSLFLTLPISWRGTIAQYAGRLHRLHDLKREVRIYDYADLNVPMLARMFDRRCKGYDAIGYKILLPASAVPGWPVDVPLPVEPEWKRDYAASVQRLIRDGVDSDLGNLFVHATRKLQANAEGEDRARSATEAFLFRRLETLPETSGKFRLNDLLPIPFADRSLMEVDLCCRSNRLAIEIDGPQHLSDPDAYRRDRRKDALLQENGYFVLRFLAGDIGTHLDAVLDAISRVLAHLRP